MNTIELVFLASPWVEAFLMSGAWVPLVIACAATWFELRRYDAKGTVSK
jgi:hypothetical protein